MSPTSRITLSIDRVVVDTEVERAAAARLPAILRQAFHTLAARLDADGTSRADLLADRVVELLETGPLPIDALLGPHGAEILAEELYRRIKENLR